MNSEGALKIENISVQYMYVRCMFTLKTRIFTVNVWLSDNFTAVLYIFDN